MVLSAVVRLDTRVSTTETEKTIASASTIGLRQNSFMYCRLRAEASCGEGAWVGAGGGVGGVYG